MTARIRFENLSGKGLGYVDFKGKKLDGSNEMADYMIEGYFETHEGATPQDFMSFFGDPKNSGSFLYYTLVDSEDDKDDYPA